MSPHPDVAGFGLGASTSVTCVAWANYFPNPGYRLCVPFLRVCLPRCRKPTLAVTCGSTTYLFHKWSLVLLLTVFVYPAASPDLLTIEGREKGRAGWMERKAAEDKTSPMDLLHSTSHHHSRHPHPQVQTMGVAEF